jgi:hypothetical protein
MPYRLPFSKYARKALLITSVILTPLRFRFMLDEFDVPSLHMVGLALGIPRCTRLDHLQLPVPPPLYHVVTPWNGTYCPKAL